MKKLGIYIHVPFCIKKCNYCDFYSVKWSDDLETKYIDAILTEINSYKDKINNNYIIDSIFFGGGTPSIAKPDNLNKIINGLSKLAIIDKNAEISMEANPNTLTLENLKLYKEIGINRLSIGIQSLNDEVLKNIGRIHNSQEALNAIKKAQEVGFENINVDVMFNIPEQSVEDIENTITLLVNSKIKHISFYSLKLEKGTFMYEMERKNQIVMPDEDDERNMYYVGRKIMEENNLLQYEISNFAEKGYECIHNLKYWNQEEYIGLGPSAHSFLNNIRYSNSSNLSLYFDNMSLKKYERVIQEELTEDDLIFEYIMLRLRLTEGINVSDFKQKFSVDFKEIYKMQINYLVSYDLLESVGDYIRLTKKGMDVSNSVIEEFMI